VAHRGQPLLSLAACGALPAPLGDRAAAGRGCRPPRWDTPRRRSPHHPSASACGWGKNGGPETAALGRSPGGFRTNIHLRAEGHGKPIAFLLTPGQRHEANVLIPLMAQGAVQRPGPGRPTRRPRRLLGDKAYSGRAIRRYRRRHGIRLTIPRNHGEQRTGPFDRHLSRQRHKIERLMNRLKQCRRMATRDEKRAATYQAMLCLAAIILWL
jgi:transposase